LPRELALRRTPSGIRLVQAPIREVSSLRATGDARIVQSRSAFPGAADIELEIAPGDWSEAGFRLSNGAGEDVTVGIKAQPLEVFVDRRRSRTTPFHDAYAERHAGLVRWVNGRIRLRAIFDRTTLEVFANGGERVISDRVYPTRPFDQIEPLHDAGSDASPIRLWELSR
jgi:sucrose-6-phosphate hydrolase SacC (GH32 family)